MASESLNAKRVAAATAVLRSKAPLEKRQRQFLRVAATVQVAVQSDVFSVKFEQYGKGITATVILKQFIKPSPPEPILVSPCAAPSSRR